MHNREHPVGLYHRRVRQLHHPQPQGSPDGGGVCTTHHQGQTALPVTTDAVGVLEAKKSSRTTTTRATTCSPLYHPEGEGQGSDSDDSQDSSDSGASAQKTREILARRPSYRKILNELSAEEVASRNEGEDENPASSGMTTVTMPNTQTIYQTSSGQYITIASNGAIQLASPGSEGLQGLQTLTMTNSGQQQGTTILQYAQTPDGQQILVPSNQVVVQNAGGEMQTYQIRTAPTAQQTVVMTSPVGISEQKSGDPTMKREIRLAKNREAARECRRKKKQYVKCLENRVAVLENQNKTLIEELKTLKDLYCVKTG
ncbi:cyclic AMP-dependent transcription factor ATF-1-like isoform X3 [Salvelinus fontinalis]|uniref:cyclic AMP-dependent transcription factor ATF-1-like isoform X3 n=1 Tax=Salvelinus fontinalis TaxID=8038 RepID=UPI00248598DB|nr:cyclic AMP-dependent transcription factor ATF-1-like isoform X3 [Salvelinus fontinalis]